MFEKFKARFDPQKSDDAFVEAATDASARQQMIDKLVAARAKMLRLSPLLIALYLFNSLLTLFAPAPLGALTARSLSASNQVLLVVIFVVCHIVTDLQIKFLKALEASAGQISREIN